MKNNNARKYIRNTNQWETNDLTNHHILGLEL